MNPEQISIDPVKLQAQLGGMAMQILALETALAAAAAENAAKDSRIAELERPKPED